MFSLLSERLCVDAAQPSAEPGSRCCDLKSRTLACVQRLRFYARPQSAPVACISGIVARHDLFESLGRLLYSVRSKVCAIAAATRVPRRERRKGALLSPSDWTM